MFYLFLFLCLSAEFGSSTVNRYFKHSLIDKIAELKDNLHRLQGKNREIAEKLIELGALGIDADWEEIISDIHACFDSPQVLRNLENALEAGKKLFTTHRIH